jgi:hypothetical protein
MRFNAKLTGAICAVCGAVLLANSAHPNLECRPRIELCAPPAIHLQDLPEKDPAPVRTTGLIEVVASSSASLSLGAMPFVSFKSSSG